MERILEFIANHLFLFALLVAVLSLLLWNLFSTLTGIRQIMPVETTHLINKENAKVLDLRSAKDFAEGHIINAINIAPSLLEGNKTELADYKDKTLVIYCLNGLESGRIGRILKMQGFQNVYCLKGGINAWQNANMPVTKTD